MRPPEGAPPTTPILQYDVPNPVFEFDGCFDPHGDNSPTGVTLEAKKKPPAGKAAKSA